MEATTKETTLIIRDMELEFVIILTVNSTMDSG